MKGWHIILVWVLFIAWHNWHNWGWEGVEWGDPNGRLSPDLYNAMIFNHWGEHYAEYEADLQRRCREEYP